MRRTELRALLPVPNIIYLEILDVPKGKALQSLLLLSTTAALPVYLGDAATAEDVFHTANGRGLTILIPAPPEGGAETLRNWIGG